jgi:hypothetical protein
MTRATAPGHLTDTGATPIQCPDCGQPMERQIFTFGQLMSKGLGVAWIGGGVIFTILIPVLGWFVGPLMVWLGWSMLTRKIYKWRCTACRVEKTTLNVG